jgi:hypothetical protein
VGQGATVSLHSCAVVGNTEFNGNAGSAPALSIHIFLAVVPDLGAISSSRKANWP